ncbi:serine hydrolase [bacterium]|nr:MAG: serine hydrolase [bacterium]
MKTLLLLILTFSIATADDYYFPPVNSEEWANKPISELGWNPQKLENVFDFLDTTGTKGFIILVGGKKVVEKYFGDFNQDSFWYWASAGKSLTSTLIGLAQQEGKLDISKPTSNYLGVGWTNMPKEQEKNIKLIHQLTMTTGLDYKVDDLDCMEPKCLNYLNEPGTHWYYHNAAYRLLLDVLDSAYSKRVNNVTNELLGDKIGMGGTWVNYVRWGKATDLARYGLFIAAGGRWGDDFKLDSKYYDAMINTSQDLNKSYGYLWWLNGKENYKLPGIDLVFKGPLVPTAPLDMYAALGKNDQKIYIVPSMKMVVVRVGDDAGDGNFASSSYDTKLWEKLSDLFVTTSVETKDIETNISPNPASDNLNINTNLSYSSLKIYDIIGNIRIATQRVNKVDISNLPMGYYNLILYDRNGNLINRKSFVKI